MSLTVLLVLGLATSAAAQAPAPAAQPAPPANANIVVEKPTYVSIPLELEVNRPAASALRERGRFMRATRTPALLERQVREHVRIPFGLAARDYGLKSAARAGAPGARRIYTALL